MNRVRVKPVRDLARIDGGDGASLEIWNSTGEDPGFLIALPFVRQRWIVIEVQGQSEILDPQLYLNFGAGFQERDTFTPAPAMRHLFVLDVGMVGLLRSLRFDPAGFATRFGWCLHSFATSEDAHKHIQARQEAVSDLRVHRIADLNRLGRVRRNFASIFLKPRVADHVERLYALARQETETVRYDGEAPWLSIVVPLYNTPKRYLNDLLLSFQSQDIAGVELILSDDASTSEETRGWLAANNMVEHVTIVSSAENGGIAAALNNGLAKATGFWVTFLDHDDLIAPQALKMIRRALDARPDAEFLYTDELIVNDRLRPRDYMLKPAYDPVLLTGVNYINHFSVFRREGLETIGYLRLGFDGSQDYDLLLRYLRRVPDDRILHLPYPAYWWRRTGRTYSRRFLDKATTNARRALADHATANDRRADVVPALTETLHRFAFAPCEKRPLVSIIIPNRNSYELISRVLGDLFERTDYSDFEVLVIDNGTTDQAVLDLYRSCAADHANFTVEIRQEAFNFSRAINRGLALAKGDHFLLLNNDIEVIHADWLDEMVSCLQFDKVGIVGARLLYPDDTLQHAGVVAGFGGLAGHWYLRKPRAYGGPMNRLHVRASMTCVTGAAILISGRCLSAVGKLDEENFAVAYNDVDFCLRAHKLGFRTVWTPFATLYHHESASRGPETKPENRDRFEREKANLRRIHATGDFLDPAASPLHGRANSTPKLQKIDVLPTARTWW